MRNRPRPHRWSSWAVVAIVGCWTCWPAYGESPQPIPLGSLPLLFADDSGVQSRSGLSRTPHLAQTLDAPVIDSGRPEDRVYIYGTVYVDPAMHKLRMWYMYVPKSGPDRILHATSEDGLAWTQPVESDVVGHLSSSSVVVDPWERDPAKRYKMLGGKREYYTSYSADGIHWSEVDKTKPVTHGGDTLTLCQDPNSGEFMLINKHEKVIRGAKRRVVGLMRSKDFENWTSAGLVMKPDEEDDAWASQPDESTQIYSMSVYPHAAGFVGLTPMLHITRVGNRGSNRSGQDGPLDVQLSSSVDGKTWERFSPRVNIIPRGEPGTFDGGGILGVSSTAVQVGDKTWVYYTAMTTGHGGAVPVKRMTIGRAEWRRDGFASLDADPMGGRAETKPLRLQKPTLLVNADASRGELRVALLEAGGAPIPGYSLDKSAVLRSDTTRWAASWQSKQQVPTDRPVRVVVALKSTRLYSLASGDMERADVAP